MMREQKGCLRVELAEPEGRVPPELQMLVVEVGRGIWFAQPEISSWVVVHMCG